jgi:hypothetical protein
MPTTTTSASVYHEGIGFADTSYNTSGHSRHSVVSFDAHR